ncbi:O-antigen ligase family protein [Dichotomicrobium thermohalophilum]|uniref:O-antigen ligase n=1 Tax=Dichotomicrobium thermohalophilum TaxID=933063 RepID=A0A397Q2V1_9HYPH|nr:O-antigen ligase family protein [Dichotomicrobium thermohalophilum]RIA55378.1 hypothetical protein BXY53_0441 [Dichotomicrobium thermohalophilum]
MIRDGLLAIGLVAAIFTQLRVSGAPIGPGEVSLLLWLLLSLVGSAHRLNAPLSSASQRLLTFWALFAAGLCVGLITAYVVGERNDPTLMRHDTIAFALVAAISLMAAIQHDAPRRLNRAAWLAAAFGSICLGVQLAQAFGALPTWGLEVWYYDRLCGWTTNANQLALLCLILFFLSLHLLETAASGSAKLAAISLALLPLMAGLLTKSDTFLLSLVAGLLVLSAIRLWHWLRTPSGAGTRSSAGMLSVLACLAMLLASAPLVYSLVTSETQTLRSVDSRTKVIERDVAYRSQALMRALDRSVESGFLGLGPGPHLMRPANLREPRYEAYPNFEVHNTLADVMLQGGLLAVIALVWLGGKAITGTMSIGLTYLPTLLAAVATFSMTHFIFRHPIVWFVLTLSLVLGSYARPLVLRRQTPRPPKVMEDRILRMTRVGLQGVGGKRRVKATGRRSAGSH